MRQELRMVSAEPTMKPARDTAYPYAAELLCACMRWPLGEDERRLIASLVGRVKDWSHFQRLILRHRVAGLASHALVTTDGALPEHMHVWCEAQLQDVALQELTAAATASLAIARIQEEGICARLLKGPAVSIVAYGRLGLRTNRDIDLLVAPEERDAAAAALASLGWARIEPAGDVSDAAFVEWLRNHKDFAFVQPDGRMLELHWGLFNNSALLAGLEHCPSRRVRSGPFTFETLPPTENILYLCVHGAEHAWSRLKWLADVNAILHQLDSHGLAELLEEGRRRRVYPAIAQTIVLCSRHLGLALPSDLVNRLERTPRVWAILRIAERALFGTDRELEEQPWGTTLKNIGHYLMAGGWRFLLAEMHFDFTDLSAAGLPDTYRRYGPLARIVAFFARPVR